MKAYGDNVIVREVETAEASDGGVFLPPSAREDPSRGEVISIGHQVQDVEVGDFVIYTEFNGHQVDDENGDPVVVIRESELLAKDVG